MKKTAKPTPKPIVPDEYDWLENRIEELVKDEQNGRLFLDNIPTSVHYHKFLNYCLEVFTFLGHSKDHTPRQLLCDLTDDIFVGDNPFSYMNIKRAFDLIAEISWNTDENYQVPAKYFQKAPKKSKSAAIKEKSAVKKAKPPKGKEHACNHDAEDCVSDNERECPKCKHVGDIKTDFGYRALKPGAKPIPQSWCRCCRSGKKRAA